MISKLFASTIAKTVAIAFVAAIFAATVAGASAAMGGPNIPSRAVSALGLDGSQNGNVSDVNDADSDTPTPTSTATSTATPTVTPTATPTKDADKDDVDATGTPGSQDFFGLCNAWSHGSDKGQANKHEAQGFAGLIAAAGATGKTGDALNNAVSDFCKTVTKPGETPSPTGPTGSGTPTSTPTPGNDSHPGNGNSGGHPGGRPDSIRPAH
jgi:hypothetical protein